MGTPFKNNFMRCYVGTDPGRASPVGQVRRATLAPFLYPLLFYQKSGQKSIILCVANLTNRRKNRRNTALEIVQYDETGSARPDTLRQQERPAPAAKQRQSAAGRTDRAEAGEKKSRESRQGQQQRQNRERRAPRPADHRQPQSRESGAIQPQGAAADPDSIRKRSQAESVRQSRERGE